MDDAVVIGHVEALGELKPLCARVALVWVDGKDPRVHLEVSQEGGQVGRRHHVVAVAVILGPGVRKLGQLVRGDDFGGVGAVAGKVLKDHRDDEVEQREVGEHNVRDEEGDGGRGGGARVGRCALARVRPRVDHEVVHDAVPRLSRDAAEESEKGGAKGVKVDVTVLAEQLRLEGRDAVVEGDAEEGIDVDEEDQQEAHVEEGRQREQQRAQHVQDRLEALDETQDASHAHDAQHADQDGVED
mmetsp:Transcript_44988/g.118769  ORF Transcript_44988/g.118769 Transcript_44988/m.118769 type:complete len:243 (+) Transcript_44988:1210-1938(+)